jgi:hypothetical protein
MILPLLLVFRSLQRNPSYTMEAICSGTLVDQTSAKHATSTGLLAYFVPECSDDPCARRRSASHAG